MGYYSGDSYDGSHDSYDQTAYIRHCQYAGERAISKYVHKGETGGSIRTCDLFRPVLTDSGICQAFNAQNMPGMMKESIFKQAFANAYKSDLRSSQVKKS